VTSCCWKASRKRSSASSAAPASKLVHDAKGREKDTPSDEVGVMEAVVGQDSRLVDKTVTQVRLYDRHGSRCSR